MKNVIAFSNLKGGTAKTTTVAHTAEGLARQGHKVLVIDTDQQASLTIMFKGLNFVLDARQSLYEVMTGKAHMKDIITTTRSNVDLVPAHINLAATEQELSNVVRKEDILRDELKSIITNYDYTLIDCAPSLGVMTINAMSCADRLIVPMSCDWLSLIGVNFLLQTITKMQRRLNPNLEVMGVLLTRFDKRTSHAQEVVEYAKNNITPIAPVFDSIIRQATAFQKASVVQQTLFEFAPSHPAVTDYNNFIEELLSSYE